MVRDILEQEDQSGTSTGNYSDWAQRAAAAPAQGHQAEHRPHMAQSSEFFQEV